MSGLIIYAKINLKNTKDTQNTCNRNPITLLTIQATAPMFPSSKFCHARIYAVSLWVVLICVKFNASGQLLLCHTVYHSPPTDLCGLPNQQSVCTHQKLLCELPEPRMPGAELLKDLASNINICIQLFLHQ